MARKLSAQDAFGEVMDLVGTLTQANPTAQQLANGDFRTVLAEAVTKALASHHSMSDQMLQNPKVFNDVAEALLPEIYERARQGSEIGESAWLGKQEH